MKTDDGLEVDFLARYWTAGQELIRICVTSQSPAIVRRELKALAAAALAYLQAHRRFLVLDRDVASAYEWLLASPDPDSGVRE